MVFVKRVVVAALISAVSIFLVSVLPKVAVVSYVTWVLFAVETAVVVATITFVFSFVFAKKELFDTMKYIKNTFLKRKKK